MLELTAERRASLPRRAWTGFVARLGTTRAERLVQALTAALLLVGFWLRARGYLYATIPLWIDEYFWAVRLFELPLKEHLIRPIGFMAASKLVTALFSRSEAGLRFVPWAAGVAALFLSSALSKRLFNSPAARLLCVAAIALQPAAIDLSKEFKPYSLGFFLHLALIWLVLRYLATGKVSDLVTLCVVAPLSVLFTQDIIFAYPAVFLVVGVEALRARRTRHLLIIVGSVLAAFALLAALYVFIWSRLDAKSDVPYWGAKYDVFYVPGLNPALSHARWIFDRYFDITVLPTQRAEQWAAAGWRGKDLNELRTVYRYVWFALHVIGLIVIALRRRFAVLVLLFSPLVVLVALNFLGRFPMGSFRADFFLLAYIAPIAAFALERSKPGARYWDPLPAALLLVLPLLVFEHDWHKNKSYFAWYDDMPRVFERILAAQDGAAGPSSGVGTLALDSRSCAGWNYYSKYQPEFSKREAPLLLAHLRPFCAEEEDDERRQISTMLRSIRESPAPEARSWLVLADRSSYQSVLKALPRELRAAQTFNVQGRHWAIETLRKP